MKFVSVLLLGLGAANAIELTPANWDSETAGESSDSPLTEMGTHFGFVTQSHVDCRICFTRDGCFLQFLSC
jgi:hypothetical protein